MAHFQLTDGTRLYVKGNSGPEKIWIHTNSEVTLEQIGTDDPRSEEIPEVISNIPKALTISMKSVTANKRTFSVKGVGADKGLLTATDPSHKRMISKLSVVSGDFKNHPNMEIDLLANVCRGSDAIKARAIRRMLYSNQDNVFEQNSADNKAAYGDMACGIVVKHRALEVFGELSPIHYETPYHEPVSKVPKRSDLRYKPSTIQTLQTRFKTFLTKGIPVRVGVVDRPDVMKPVNGKLIAYFAGGHTVLIVGCDKAATQFLYIDPWGWGSEMLYQGGISSDLLTDKCEYLGVFTATYDKDRLLKSSDAGKANVLRQDPSTEGTFNTASGNFLEVVSGP